MTTSCGSDFLIEKIRKLHPSDLRWKWRLSKTNSVTRAADCKKDMFVKVCLPDTCGGGDLDSDGGDLDKLLSRARPFAFRKKPPPRDFLSSSIDSSFSLFGDLEMLPRNFARRIKAFGDFFSSLGDFSSALGDLFKLPSFTILARRRKEFGAFVTRISGICILEFSSAALIALDKGPNLRISRSFLINETPSLFVVWTISSGSSFGERILIPVKM